MRLPIILLSLALVLGAAAAPAAARSEPRVGPHEGLASWLDVYDRKPWRHPSKTVARLRAKGVRTLYLQTSNYQRYRDIIFRDEVGAFLEAAHAVDMKVVAWYVPSFQRVGVDLRRSMKAIDYRSPRGDSFDSFAMDIEADHVRKISKRNARLMRLSKRIRSAVGGDYSLGAIIPDPKTQRYWPNFPYRRVAKIYDVFLPMSYWTFRTKGYGKVYNYTKNTLWIIRKRTRDDDVPIHMIGGLAGDAPVREIKAFTRAVREKGAIGASLYDIPLMSPTDWLHLKTIRRVGAPVPKRSEERVPELPAVPANDRQPAAGLGSPTFVTRLVAALLFI